MEGLGREVEGGIFYRTSHRKEGGRHQCTLVFRIRD